MHSRDYFLNLVGAHGRAPLQNDRYFFRDMHFLLYAIQIAMRPYRKTNNTKSLLSPLFSAVQ